MTVRAWPFLIGRVRNAGHRVVVAPDFLLESGGDAVLHPISRGRDTPDGEAIYDRLKGRVAVVSRVFEAHATDCNLPGEDIWDDDVLRDRTNRPIRLTEGLVFMAEPGGPPPSITSEDFAHVHRAVMPAYREFWYDEGDYQPRPSQALPSAEPSTTSVPLVLREGTPIVEAEPEPSSLVSRLARACRRSPDVIMDQWRRLRGPFGLVLVIIVLVLVASVTVFARPNQQSNRPPTGAPTNTPPAPTCDDACAKTLADRLLGQFSPEASQAFCSLFNMNKDKGKEKDVDETVSMLENPASADHIKQILTVASDISEQRREEAGFLGIEIQKLNFPGSNVILSPVERNQVAGHVCPGS